MVSISMKVANNAQGLLYLQTFKVNTSTSPLKL